jgi:hypothetical protein
MNKLYFFLSFIFIISSSCKKQEEERSVLTLNKVTTEILVGSNESLTASLQTNGDKTVSWFTSDPTIAVVSSSGVITGKKKGKVFINAFSVGGGNASCAVTVQELNDQIVVTPTYVLTTSNGVSSQESYFTLNNKTNYPVTINSWNLSNLQGIFIVYGLVDKSIASKDIYTSVRLSTLHDPWKMSHELHVLPITIDITFEKNKYGISLTESADGKITQTMVKF